MPPSHNDNSGKNWCMGGMVAPCRSTLAKSKQKSVISIILSHTKTVIDDKSCNEVHATFVGCCGRGGTLKKYPRQVEAKNGPDRAHYYYCLLPCFTSVIRYRRFGRGLCQIKSWNIMLFANLIVLFSY